MSNSVLILTAGFGEGHNAAARNLRDALLRRAPSRKVVVSDIFLESYGWINRLTQHGYLAAINHAPALWQAAFDVMHRSRLVDRSIGIFRRAEQQLEQRIDELKPKVVVSTYPGCNHLLDHLYRRRLKRPFRTVTIITDSITVNAVWHRAFSDRFVVANEATAVVLRRQGVRESRIAVTGFPVPEVFASMEVARPIPPPDGRWRVLYVINSGRELAPAITAHLLALPNIDLSVTVGRDESLGRHLAEDAARAGRPLTVHGWTPEMPRLMAENHLIISKAGGATVQEALAACTPMIITQIVPGQEEGNARLLLESGAGALATTAEAIGAAVHQAFAHDGAQWQDWHAAAQALSRPRASAEIAQQIDELARA